MPDGPSGGFKQGRSRGREFTFMEHPLCAGHCSGRHNPPKSQAVERGFWFYTHKEIKAQRVRAVSWDHREEVAAESCHLPDFKPILFPLHQDLPFEGAQTGC